MKHLVGHDLESRSIFCVSFAFKELPVVIEALFSVGWLNDGSRLGEHVDNPKSLGEMIWFWRNAAATGVEMST